MQLPTSFYVRLSAACFVLGGCMELFMNYTGFYNVVKLKEAERFLETKDERIRLRDEVAKRLQEKGIDLPPTLQK